MDVLDLAATRHEEDFAEWLKEERTEIDFLNDLAEKEGVVLMYGLVFLFHSVVSAMTCGY